MPESEITIKNKLIFFLCRLFGHKEVFAGACPYTGMRYNYCERCEYILPLDYIE